MKLVIVESPTKAKTISRFLSSDFVVRSSYGHIRDLPKSKIGVDVENNFEPTYVIPEKSKKIIAELSGDVKKAECLILATDEDREGEAIAWHLAEALGFGSPKPETLNSKQIQNSKLKIRNSKLPQVERIVFHEITERAIKEALNNPRGIDLRLVDAQQARRVLDRLIGYELSPFLWRKIHYGLSAGRVQSAALRLIVEREREREKFQSQEYWSIEALLQKIQNSNIKIQNDNSKLKNNEFQALLIKKDGEIIPKLGIKTNEEAEGIVKDLKEAEYEVINIEKKEVKRNPLSPFTTSTLQQAAWQWLRFSAKQTMMLSQKLYENGHITYMRTDSLNLSQESLRLAQKFLSTNLGERYSLSVPRVFAGKSKLAQEAHEAIRPTDPFVTPEELKQTVSPREYRLYDLIWRRFIATQMPEAVLAQISATIIARKDSLAYTLRASGQSILFDGFLKIWRSRIEEKFLPDLTKGEKLIPVQIVPKQHFTQPPPRYSDASLVKALEECGIGRPSTYAPTIATLEARNYIERDENRSFKPTGTGVIVTELLEKHFPSIVDYGFTAGIEDELDEIARGRRQWVPVVKEVYVPFHQNLLVKEQEVTRQEATERPSDAACDKCFRPMVTKYGRFGPFLACSGYPECKNIKKIPKPTLGIKCPKCNEGDVVTRRTRAKKRIFYGCSRWPACDFASWKKPNSDT
jgi:DNA topoisomerase-1